MAVIDRQDRWVQPTEIVVAARDQVAGTLTLTGFAGLRAQVRRRLDLFARQAPANEAAP